MNRFSFFALLAAALLGGCNLTYDREGVEFVEAPPPGTWPPVATTLDFGVDATGTIPATATPQYYVLTVPAGGLEVRFQTFDPTYGLCDAIAPAVTVRDADGNYLEGDYGTGRGNCADMALNLSQGTYYVEVGDSAYGSASPPYDFVVRATAGPIGGSSATLSCDRTSSVGYCHETSGTLTLADVVDFEWNCNSLYGFVAQPHSCPASTLSGYCLSSFPFYAGASYSWVYYSPTYDQLGAESSCVGYGSWIGGATCTAPAITCDLGYGAYCADLSTDSTDCGVCGQPCAPGAYCAGNACVGGDCVAPYAVCYEGPGNVCLDLRTDPNNCGACGVACGAGTLGTCSGGYCDLACGVATPNHCGSGATQYCADFLNDPANCSACNTACTTCVGGVCDGGAVTLTVSPLFLNGAKWNDWVVGSGYAAAIDTACDPAGGADCIHAGDLRAVTVTGKSSCNFLSATDALGAFDWVCDGSTNPVRFLSTGLKPGKRLADLLDVYTPGYRSNSVTVWDGAAVYGSTSSGAWWTNPVAFVPTTGILDVPGTLYVADGTVSPPFQLQASSVALAVPTGTVFATVPASIDDVVSAYFRNFLWVEGDFDANGGNHGVFLYEVRYSVVREASVTRLYDPAEKYGLYLVGSSRNRVERFTSSGSSISVYLSGATASDNRFSDLALSVCPNNCLFIYFAERNVITRVTARGGLGNGVLVYSANFNELSDIEASGFDGSGLRVMGGAMGNAFRNVSVAANHASGLLVDGGTFNEFSGITVTNNGVNGVVVQAGRNNSFFSVLAANNGGNGIISMGGADDRYAAITASLNGAVGFTLSGTNGNVVGSVALHGNGWRGMQIVDAVNTTLADLAIAGSQQGLVEEGASSGNAIHGRLLVGANAEDCFQGSALGAFDAACSPMEKSTFVAPTPIGTLGASFFGRVPSDSLNPNAGLAVYVDDLDATWLDWTSFENGFRAWAPVPTADGSIGCPGDSNSRTVGACLPPGTWIGNAEAWDWSLSRNDLVLRASVPDPTGLDVVTHQFSDSTIAQLLLHAVELPGYGDGDGLCEDGEACLQLWNFGAYQGPGTVELIGVVSGGSLPVGVALYRVPPVLNGI